MIDYSIAENWLFDIAIKASGLLLVVWVGSFTLRKRSAAAQHRWWTLGFIGCLMIPAVGWLTPAWTLPVFTELNDSAELMDIDSKPTEIKRVAERIALDASSRQQPAAPHGEDQRGRR